MITVKIARPITAVETVEYEYESIEAAKNDIAVFLNEGYLPDKDGEWSVDDFGDVPELDDWGDVYIDGDKVAFYDYNKSKGIKSKSWDSKVLGDMYD